MQPRARDKRGVKRAVAAEAMLEEEEEERDEVMLHGEDDEEHFTFVDDDDEGDLASPVRTVPQGSEAAPSRRQKVFKIGKSSKNADLEVVSPYGTMLEASDGTVKINLAKLILHKVTDEEIASKRHVDGKGKSIDATCWRCLVPRFGEAKTAHNEFVRAGVSTGNLMQHCVQHHPSLLEGLQRVIGETPKAEAKVACETYMHEFRPPAATLSLDRMLGMDEGDASNELLCLVWFLDANIAFVQFDNPLFHELV
jgi:hypothetical protein